MSEHYVSNFEPGLWGVCYRDSEGRQITIAECFEVEQAERIAAALAVIKSDAKTREYVGKLESVTQARERIRARIAELQADAERKGKP